MIYKTFPFLVFLLTLSIFAPAIVAQPLLSPGWPDPTFGTNGRVPVASQMYCSDAALQTDGKIVVLCPETFFRDSVQYYGFLFKRFNADGTIDVDFGENGLSSITLGQGRAGAIAVSVAARPDGKIVAAGTLNNDFVVLRIDPDGSLDPTFGENGRIEIDFADFEESSLDRLSGMVALPDGKIFLYGHSWIENVVHPCSSSNPQLCPAPPFRRTAMARLNADGAPDSSFGINGTQKTRVSNGEDMPQEVFLQAGSKILMKGLYFWMRGWQQELRSAFVRFNADGSLDESFGRHGYSEEKLGSELFAALPDGKFIGLCFACTGNNTNSRVLRYDANLTVDNDFSPVGHYLAPGDARKMAAHPDGKFLLSVSEVLFRFNDDGRADLTFGNNGAVTLGLAAAPGLRSSTSKILFQPDGKILVFGSYFPAPGNPGQIFGTAVVRLIGRSGKRALQKSIFPAR